MALSKLTLSLLEIAYGLARAANYGFFGHVGLPSDCSFAEFRSRYERYGEEAATCAMAEVMGHAPTAAAIRQQTPDTHTPKKS